MPKRTDIESVLVLGAGPIVIGQACEFDYSGVQACRTLREEGYRVILVNSNPATIMTDPNEADATYIEPLIPQAVERILEREKPDAVLPTMGGQTALNLAMRLADTGTLDAHGVQLIGARADVIARAEDREQFRQAMTEEGITCPRAHIVASLSEAEEVLHQVGLPAVLRPSFTLGGRGGGIAYNQDEFFSAIANALEASPIGTVLVEQSVLGWKEYELEVVRDYKDNCMIVCSIENIDPMGVHTGDSLTVAPAQTLTDKEYQILRDQSIACLRKIGVETGGSNVQFAVNPENGETVIIEMNPRVSRSSALASKATGFPIARVATRLALGYALDEIANEVSGTGPASFEPSLDWVVVKAPRFDFDKFHGTQPFLTTSMKSVGEAMSIAGSFPEALQKVYASLEVGLTGMEPPWRMSSFATSLAASLAISGNASGNTHGNTSGNEKNTSTHSETNSETNGETEKLQILLDGLGSATPERFLLVAEAFRRGAKLTEIRERVAYDPWFLTYVQSLVETEREITQQGKQVLQSADGASLLRHWKAQGFTDARIASLINDTKNSTENDTGNSTGNETGNDTGSNTGNKSAMSEQEVRAQRKKLGVKPSYRRIDTCAAEFKSQTPYLYSLWDHAPLPEADEAEVSARKKVLILGGGPNRIGQGIEFDYCCVHGVQATRAMGFEAIMVNCNPETVSTDYNTADRLYFEPLTTEHVLEVADKEREQGELLGAIVQFGGQTPLGLAQALEDEGLPILGTAPAAIARAEDRDEFQQLLEGLSIRQPAGGVARSVAEAVAVAERIGYPLMLRPSFVLGGRAMRRVDGEDELLAWIENAVEVSGVHPVLLDSYLNQAVEVDVDALGDGQDIWFAGAMEHVEEAGIHSGDSACSYPANTIAAETIEEICRQTQQIGKALGVVGLLNIQFAITRDENNQDQVYVLEVNPRASRTVPFLTKATGLPLARMATQLMLGSKLADLNLPELPPTPMKAVKESIFPFDRFPGVDVLLGPEMRSTGEVMGIDQDFDRAFWKAQLALGFPLPDSGGAFLSVRKDHHREAIALAQDFQQLGFSLFATPGTAEALRTAGLAVETVHKVHEGQRPNVLDRMISGEINIVVNTPSGRSTRRDSDSIRNLACKRDIPCFTTLRAGRALTRALAAARTQPLAVACLQDYFSSSTTSATET